MGFEVIETDKLGGNWKQGLAVVRENTVYLRLVGDGTNYRVMTATAGEEFGGYEACRDKERLWAAALRLAGDFGTEGDIGKDLQGRKYVKIFDLSQGERASDKSFTDALMDLFQQFFTLYDTLEDDPRRQK